MSPDKNNWQDLASDLGLSFEIDPNAPELPPEPEPVVILEKTVITTVTVAEDIQSLESTTDEVSEDSDEEPVTEPGTERPGEESAEAARKRKRGRRRRRGRGPNEGGSSELDGPGSDEESGELVTSAVGGGLLEAGAEEEDSHHSGHGHSSNDEDEFVLEDLTNLNVPVWVELIDSLYRPER